MPASATTGQLFRPPQYTVGATFGPAVLVYDWDRDQHPDALVPQGVSDSVAVAILRNNHEGVLDNIGPQIATPIQPVVLGGADVNGDGIEDLVMGIRKANTGFLATYLSDGTGLHPGPKSGSFGGYSDMAFGDWDEDGDLDIALTVSSSIGSISVAANDGMGGFTGIGGWFVGGAAQVVAGDVNGDGNEDVAVAAQMGVLLLLGDGAGRFALQEIPHDDVPGGILLADLNKDGALDIVVTDVDNYRRLSVFRGYGDGTFEPATSVATGPHPGYLVQGDFNGDGFVDVATGSINYHTGVHLNDGAGNLLPRQDVYTAESRRIAVADFDGNGYDDLIAAAFDTVTVLLNASGGVVATLVAGVQQDVANGVATVTWFVEDPRVHTADVFRRDEGDWEWLGRVWATAGRIVWNDASVVPGRWYHYRLGIRLDEGVVYAGEVIVDIPFNVSFRLSSVNRESAKGEMRVLLTTPQSGEVDVSVWDISGRRMKTLRWEAREPGTHEVKVAGVGEIPPGVYVVHARQGGDMASVKAITLR